MIRRRDRGRDDTVGMEDVSSLESAWRIHQLQMDWTGNVDAKAAFAFTIESAVIATTVTLSSKGRLFADIHSCWLLVLYAIGLGFLLLAAVFSAAAVIPRLRRSDIDRESAQNFIYFGHARHWDPADLESALRSDPILPQLSRQIVVAARIAWTKHIRVQYSFLFAVAGFACLVVCALFNA